MKNLGIHLVMYAKLRYIQKGYPSELQDYHFSWAGFTAVAITFGFLVPPYIELPPALESLASIPSRILPPSSSSSSSPLLFVLPLLCQVKRYTLTAQLLFRPLPSCLHSPSATHPSNNYGFAKIPKAHPLLAREPLYSVCVCARFFDATFIRVTGGGRGDKCTMRLTDCL